jgi:hypothetical protein
MMRATAIVVHAVNRGLADFGPVPTRVQRYKRALGITGTFVFLASAETIELEDA